MDTNTLLYLIEELRNAQKAYYNCPHSDKQKKRELLGAAKYQEKRIDNYLSVIKAEKNGSTLFSEPKANSTLLYIK